MCRMRPFASFGVLASLLATFMITSPAGATPKTQISIVFRCDDYSNTSDTEFELRLIDLFRKHRVAITLSVIPFAAGEENIAGQIRSSGLPLNEMKARILRDAMDQGVVEVAQHG